MALNILLSGVDDERLLMSYLARRPVYVCGIKITKAGDPIRVPAADILELDYSEPLTPVILYMRPHQVGKLMSEAILDPTEAEANPAVGQWYKRVYSWCGGHAKNVFSWKHDMFPGQFVSNSVNTRWAFPGALAALQQGAEFCARGIREESIEIARHQQHLHKSFREM